MNKITWGINSLNHGTSIAVFENFDLKSNKFYPVDEINDQLIDGPLPDEIYWYEKPLVKKLRQLRAGQYSRAFDFSVMPKRFLSNTKLAGIPIKYTPHHASHAAAGYYTSPFNHCAIIVLDAIGEFECATIWEGKHGEIKKLWHRNYPHSLGLFYSAFTDLVGLTPIKQEYEFQKMSELGDPDRFYSTVLDYMLPTLRAVKNLHKGVTDWPHPIDCDQDRYDIAAAVQAVFERQISLIHTQAKKLIDSDCLVYMGGCAMNSLANQKIVEPMWQYRWSLPQPGDPSSSIGAVLYHTKMRQLNKDLGVVKHIKISV